jgi:hypothetical protein
MNSVIVFGGRGVFGSQVARALVDWGVPLTLAGRNATGLTGFAQTLGSTCRTRVADVGDATSCRAALAGHHVAVNCAGPFQRLDTTLLEACLQTGCHYVDIADDRGYAARVRSFHERFTERGLAAVYGCSSLPGISGALALLAREGTTAGVERVRVTLFIGNKNPKGSAAVRSLLEGLGKPIPTPQGARRGFRDREVVSLPPPFGRRAVFNFDAPEYDLFPSLLGAREVIVKVGFELRLATYAFALLAALGSGYGATTARLLQWPATLVSKVGCSGGALMTELFLADGSVRRAALAGRADAQRMASLPCALVTRGLCQGTAARPGTATAYEFLGARKLLDELVAAGFSLHTDEPRSGPRAPPRGRQRS